MNILINYAHGAFLEARKQNSITGLRHGFDAVVPYGKEDIHSDFLSKHKSVFDLKRGAGYWLWKPYIIRDCMRKSDDGDVIFYSDSGASFVKNISPLLERVLESDTDVCGFQVPGNHMEKQYNKKETLEHFGMYTEAVLNSKQHMGGFICVKNSDKSKMVIDDWLQTCDENSNLLLDVDGSVEQHEEFVEHRHDQAIWSLVIKKHNVMTLPSPCQYGLGSGEKTESDVYIDLHRQGRFPPGFAHLPHKFIAKATSAYKRLPWFR